MLSDLLAKFMSEGSAAIVSKLGVIFKGRLLCFVCMDVVALVSSCFIRNKKSREVKVVAVLDYMFHGSSRRVKRFLAWLWRL
jgi:hypothetical protein